MNKAKMLSAGVSDIVLKFLPSERPPVQFKLLGTLRMLIDTQGTALGLVGNRKKQQQQSMSEAGFRLACPPVAWRSVPLGGGRGTGSSTVPPERDDWKG